MTNTTQQNLSLITQENRQDGIINISKEGRKRKKENKKQMEQIKNKYQGTWLAQSVQHVTLDLGVVNLSPTLGIEVT